jgi:DNA primase
VEQLDARSVKERLPIAYVLDRYGIAVRDYGGGDFAAVCPFHQDGEPSLDVYGERLERWGCFPCGLGGDVFDLIARLAWPSLEPAFSEVRAYALVLLRELEESDWNGPRVGVSRRFDAQRARVTVETSALRQPKPVNDFITAKHHRGELLGLGAITLRQTWRVGSRVDEIVIPYYDWDDNLVSYKHRTADTPAVSAPGSNFDDVLYGAWKDDGSQPVLLCEGESDAWAAYAVAADVYAVLAVPTGAGAYPKPEQLARLAGRDVRIAFDGDAAGAIGAAIWQEHLDSAQIVLVPEGTDIAKLAPTERRALLTR